MLITLPTSVISIVTSILRQHELDCWLVILYPEIKSNCFPFPLYKVGKEGKAVMNQKDRDGRTPLVTAILEESSIEVIKRLLQEEIVDVNSRDDDGDVY